MILVVVCRILVSLADTYITIPASPESVVSGEAPDTVTGSESGVGGREGQNQQQQPPGGTAI